MRLGSQTWRRYDTIAIGLEAIAPRLEAIAIRLEAIARVEVSPVRNKEKRKEQKGIRREGVI